MYIPKCFHEQVRKEYLIKRLKEMYKKDNKETQSKQLPQDAVRRCLTFIPLWDYNYELKFNKPSFLKVMYHIYSSVIILSIPIVIFLRWYLNIA